jgi:hypothetical protein
MVLKVAETDGFTNRESFLWNGIRARWQLTRLKLL